MTLSTQTSRVSYNGDGAQTLFDVTFPFVETSHIAAILRDTAGAETTWAEGTDYTIAGGAGGTGELTATTPPAAGETLTIRRVVPLTQETDYPEGGKFPAASHETALDYARMVDQQQEEVLDRAIVFPATDPQIATGEIAPVATRANKLWAFKTDGSFDYVDPTDASSEAVTASGSSIARLLSQRFGDMLSAKDDGATGDGVTNDAAKFQAVVTAAAKSALLVPKGTFLLASKIALPPAGLTIEGQGFDSVLKVGAASQTILEMIAGGWLRLYNIRLIGDGTTSNIGLSTIDTGDIDLDTVWFDGFGAAEINLNAITGAPPTERSRARLRNITCLNSKSANAAAEEGHISIRGNWRDILVDGLFGEAAAATPKNNGIVIVEAAADETWERCILRNINLSGGHGKRGIVITNEISAANFESGKCIIDGAIIHDTTQFAIKTKNVDRILMSNIYAQDCDATPEIAGNLQGTIFINGCEDFTGDNIQVHGCGTDGIRFNGRNAGTDAGIGRSKLTLSNFICNTADESGVFISHNVRDLTLNAPQCYDCAIGLRIQTTTALAPPDHITINAPRIRRCTGSGTGIIVAGLSGENIGTVIINAPDIFECGGFGILGTFTNEIQVNGGVIADNSTSVANTTDGMRFDDCVNVKIYGVRSTDTGAATQRSGLSFGGGNTNLDIKGCDFRGNVTDTVAWVAPSGIARAADNNGWLEGSHAFDPASIAAGATLDGGGFLVSDAAFGDQTEAAFSLNLQGLIMTSFVSAASFVRIRLFNPTAGAINLAAGTLTFRVRK